jgi:hypothetical protein
MKGIIGWFFRMASELSPDGIRAVGETSWGFSSLLSGCFISFHLEDGGDISGMKGHPHPQEGGEVRHLSAVEADRQRGSRSGADRAGHAGHVVRAALEWLERRPADLAHTSPNAKRW